MLFCNLLFNANTLELKLGSHEAACYDIHAHLRGPVTPEDVAPVIREIKWYDGYNQPHTSMPDVVFDSDVPICTFTLNPKCRALIPTGMVMDIPLGFSARLHPRSGLAVKNGVTLINAEGVIDADYCHEVFVPLHNTTNTPFKITHGDRIAQVEIVEYDTSSLAIALYGNQTKSMEDGIYTIYDSDNNIYKQLDQQNIMIKRKLK